MARKNKKDTVKEVASEPTIPKEVTETFKVTRSYTEEVVESEEAPEVVESEEAPEVIEDVIPEITPEPEERVIMSADEIDGKIHYEEPTSKSRKTKINMLASVKTPLQDRNVPVTKRVFNLVTTQKWGEKEIMLTAKEQLEVAGIIYNLRRGAVFTCSHKGDKERVENLK